ncbi:hypothetical protein [Lacticaseibacillus porcinae]|uniref:hypothetical protein n=1 Tax=Lacticaseibacillus porcinae TaxID=1123687 RepID=UPI000F7A4979|nr:hypothetical protein [Lacticaseibacillus porcinae]
MAKSQKLLWYAEYDRLFVKKKRTKRKRQINRATVVIVILAALTPQAFRLWPQVESDIHVAEHRSSLRKVKPRKFVDNYALKVAGLKRTAAVDKTRNLVATVKGHDVTFSNGYHLSVNSRFRVSETVNDHIVTPSVTADGYPHTIADFSGKKDHDYLYGTLQLYGNLIGDFDADGDANALNLVKVFKQENIGSTQTGYVFDIPNPKESRSYVRLTRYFLFADGTGVIVKSMPDFNSSSKKLNQKSSFKAFQSSFQVDFDSLAQDYTLTTSTMD